MNAPTPAYQAPASLISDTRKLANKLAKIFNSQDADQDLKNLLNDVTPALISLTMILEHRAQQQ